MTKAVVSTKTTSVAVFGTGSIGSRHLDVLRGMPDAKPVAVPVRLERLQTLQSEGYAASGLLRDCGASFAVIATTTGRHLQDSLEAIQNGMDLLIEKPMAINTSQAREIQKAASKAGRNVFVGCNMRFLESLQAFRRLLPEIGQPRAVQIECRSYLPDWRPQRDYRTSYSAKVPEGGVLLDLIHEIDYAGWLFGWPEQLEAKLQNTGELGIETEEIADLRWQTPKGASVSIHLDYLTQQPSRRMSVQGDRGRIEWDGIAHRVSCAAAGKAEQVFVSKQTRNEMMRAQTEAFLRQGKNSPLATAEEGVRALAVCDAARTASKQGKAVSIDYGI